MSKKDLNVPTIEKGGLLESLRDVNLVAQKDFIQCVNEMGSKYQVHWDLMTS